MWKLWKKENIGISVTALALICIIVSFTVNMNESSSKTGIYRPHLMVEDTVYWLSGTFPTVSILPEGFTEFARVEKEIPPNTRAEKNGEANGFTAGAAIYRSDLRPGWIYAQAEEGRWSRLTVIELQKRFLRYTDVLYLSERSIPDESDAVLRYNPDDFTSTGEIVHWPGDHEVIPTENLATNDSFCSGGEIFLNRKQPDLLLVKRTHTQAGKTETEYHAFVTAKSLGLDYSAYE